MRNIILTIALIVILAPPVHAQWQIDGVQVGSLVDPDPTMRRSVPDGSGGIIFTWRRFAGPSGSDIYVQRVSPAGVAMWTASGVAACAAPGVQFDCTIASDGAGGAFVAWQDNRNGPVDIYAQHVNSSGVAQWGSGGMAVCTAPDDQVTIAARADGAGGVIMSWTDYRNQTVEGDIYAQKIDSAGIPQWTAGGVPVCTASSYQYKSSITTDDAGGAIITWGDSRIGQYAQRVSAAGQMMWTTDGAKISGLGATQALIDRDGSGGAFVAWSDNRNGNNRDVFVQRVDSGGGILFAADGVTVCAAPNDQFVSALAFDGANYLYIVWIDTRSDVGDVYGQVVGLDAQMYWGPAGSGICAQPNVQICTSLACDATGCLLTWVDERAGSTNRDIYAQKVTPGGGQWGNGVEVCTAPLNQRTPEIVSDGASGAMVGWFDERTPGQTDVYAERVSSTGEPYAFVVIKTADDDTPGSLRAALRQANALPGPQTISFNIPGPGPHTITLTSQLPAITDDLVIDGYTQPGSSPNTNPVGSPCNAHIMIDIHGGFTIDGFVFQAPGTLRGVATHSFDGRDVIVEATPVVIEGNYIGLDAGGYGGWSNQVGIWIGADNCRVGGAAAAARNVISEGSFQSTGIKVEGATSTVITGNYIGADPNLSDNGVGNTTGILVEGFALVTVIGSSDFPMNPQEANVIAYNGTGISILGPFAAFGHAYGNSFRGNSTMAIDLGGDGRTANDPGDSDTGPNQLQNFPDVAAASGTQITGAMHGLPNSSVRIDFYRSGALSPLNSDIYLGRTTVTTNGSGDAPFTFALAQPIPPAVITATAHDSFGDTSEISDFVFNQNTPAGANVVVNLVDANGTLRGTATFSQVSSGNNTYVVNPFAPPVPVPGVFSVGNPSDPARYFNVYTQASYGGGVDICLFYDENNIPGPETSLVLVHYNGSAWEDVTTSRDTVNNTICGHASSLSPFAIAVPVPTGVHDEPIPNQFALHPNVPNPFNPTTTIRYDVPRGGADVNISIYDVAGRLVRELVREHRPAGVFSVQWNGDDDRGQRVASGVYFYRMRAGEFVETRKMVLLK